MDFSVERNPETNSIYVAILPILSRTTSDYNITGLSPGSIFFNNRGYLIIITNDGVTNKSSDQVTLRLDKYTDTDPSTRTTIDETTTNLTYNEFHHLNITKTLDFKGL